MLPLLFFLLIHKSASKFFHWEVFWVQIHLWSSLSMILINVSRHHRCSNKCIYILTLETFPSIYSHPRFLFISKRFLQLSLRFSYLQNSIQGNRWNLPPNQCHRKAIQEELYLLFDLVFQRSKSSRFTYFSRPISQAHFPIIIFVYTKKYSRKTYVKGSSHLQKDRKAFVIGKGEHYSIITTLNRYILSPFHHQM